MTKTQKVSGFVDAILNFIMGCIKQLFLMAFLAIVCILAVLCGFVALIANIVH